MKTFFVPATFVGKAHLEKEMIDKLPKNVGIVSTTQFLGKISEVKEQLKNAGKKVFVGKSLQGNFGQLLGCDVSSAEIIDEKIDAFLYLGSGEFHPRGVGLKTEKDIFVFNPSTNEFRMLPMAEVDSYKNRKKAGVLKFLSSKEVGIIVSLKQGQNGLVRALEMKRKFKEKNFYVFAFETIDFSQLENFPFVECWVNSACPRINEDLVCVNLKEVEEIIENKEY